MPRSSWWTAWPASRCRPRRSGPSRTITNFPAAIVINKLDRERADFQRALDNVQEIFGRAAVPIQIPIGSEREFTGVVDLIRMKAYTYTPDGDGKGKEGDIPADLADAATEGPRSAGRDGRRGQRRPDGRVLRKGHAARRAHHRRPASRACATCGSSRCMCASGLHNIGTDQILNFIVENLPAPDRAAKSQLAEGEPEDRGVRPGLACSSSRPPPTRSPAASPTSRCMPAS